MRVINASRPSIIVQLTIADAVRITDALTMFRRIERKSPVGRTEYGRKCAKELRAAIWRLPPSKGSS